MRLKNTEDQFGWISIILHWLMAVLFFSLFGLGLYMIDLNYYHPFYRSSLDLHKNIGIIFLFLAALRILWRIYSAKPHPLSRNKTEKWLATLTHIILYCGLLLLPVSGFLISTADGRSIEFFSLFNIQALPWSFEHQEDISGDIHNIIAWGMIIIITLHALAALKHHLINKDATLKRMLYSSDDKASYNNQGDTSQ